ncbi:hypothetical protein K474DRAFT_1699662 [Panus rudis PR-1116 ss-1]|nr:hypothetical protein K474DRAFT_1699662 [Panus rudis PR-1116 ss-1]
MGTKGYIHRKRYYLRYMCRDGFDPTVFALDMASEVPREPEEFQRWLAATRKALDEFNPDNTYERVYRDDESDDDGSPDEFDALDFYGDMGVVDEYQLTEDEDGVDGTMVLMDLDDLAFTMWPLSPIFRLDHMPPEDVFIRCLNGSDHYNNNDCTKDTPQGYRFSYSSPPPKFDAEMQTMYFGHQAAQPMVPVSHLLCRSEALSSQEATRVRLLEVAVAAMMTMYPDAVVVQKASGLKDRENLLRNTLGVAPSLYNSRLIPHTSYSGPTRRERYLHALTPMNGGSGNTFVCL